MLLLGIACAALATAARASPRDAAASYVELISSLRSFYNASSAFIVCDECAGSMRSNTILFECLRGLSGSRTFSQVLRLSELAREYNSSFATYSRQLFVLAIESESELLAFEQFSRQHLLSFHAWLVLFQGTGEPGLRDTCTKPEVNRFHLQYDTRMLVKCYDEPVLREWYSNEGKLVVKDLMVWSKEQGLVLTTQMDIYRRRGDVAGAVLRVASMRRKAPSHHEVGLFASFFGVLAVHMNFSVESVAVDTFYGSYNKEEASWSGVLGRVQAGDIDVVVSDVSMTQERVQAFDFAGPIVLGRDRLYVKEPGSAVVQWNAYLKAFNYNIWLLIVAVIVISGLLLTFINMVIKKDAKVSKSALVENHLNVWGIFCQQGLAEFPKSSPLRITYVSIFFSAIVLSAIYSASIISHLTTFTATLPFNSLPSYLRSGKHMKLIVIRNSAEFDMFRNSPDIVLSKMNKLMKNEEDLPMSDIEGFEQVCQENVAFYTNGAMTELLHELIKCKVVGINTGRFDNVAFALTKNNPYTEFMNYNILRFQDVGIAQRIKSLYFKKKERPAKNFDSVEFLGTTPLVVILGLGMLSSAFMLVAEKVFYKFTRLNVVGVGFSGRSFNL